MALVPGICTQCGATLSADNSKDCMICPYCGTPFIVEKAISNFHNTYNITNSTVHIYGGKISDFVIRAGVLEKYTGSSTSVTIPSNVVAIGRGAFKECHGLKEINIPEGVVSIEEEAFHCCKALQKVTLPNTLKEIGWGAFEYCDSLSEISLPDNVIKIKSQAFYYCHNLVKVKMPNNLHRPEEKEYEYSFPPFYGCNNLINVLLPNESWISVLGGTPFHSNWRNQQEEKELVKKKQHMQLQEYRRRNNLCIYCGGRFSGFPKKCTNCGKKKDY